MSNKQVNYKKVSIGLALLMTNNGKNFLGHQIIPSKWVKKYLAKVRSLKDALSAQV
jgi:hypothetical protein